MLMAKVMIEAAINGMNLRDQNRNIAYSNEEVIADAVATTRAGASMIHFHAKQPDGGWNDEVDDLAAIMRGIRAEGVSPILWPTFSGGADVPQRFRHYTALSADPATKPDVGACDMGSVNLAWWDEANKRYIRTHLYQNLIDTTREVIEHHTSLGLTRPTLQIFEPGHLRTALKFLEMGVLGEPLLVKFYLGGPEQPFGLPPTPASLEAYADMLKGVRASWFASCFGGDIIPLLPYAIAMGGHCRIGLEDHDYKHEGQPTNVELVKRCVAIIEAMGHEVATPEDARALLEI
ncbi:3-keto-5-aminohexanoate cleavage protein [Sphingomonas crocodyli]|uniref:3-keto-5-aminohexanoate cleavage protein n=2 Tax=Sphingomonas crocodyli TaxID=1979270 RepID=A0A437MA70_9SPHN|nr:3-keto-5-aminohexanoate cleavage protein [Sphingomonas crocodyli]